MSSVTLYRASGLALLLEPVLFIIGLPLSLVFQTGTPLELVMIGVWTSGAVLLGLPGIVARQASCAGWLGFVGFLLTFSGAFLAISYYTVVYLVIYPWLNVHAPQVGDQLLFSATPAVTLYNSVAIGLFVVGLLLLGIATMRARVFPQWAGLLLIVGAVLDPIGFVSGIVGTVAAVLVTLGLGWDTRS
jgi:hypothetical protein